MIPKQNFKVIDKLMTQQYQDEETLKSLDTVFEDTQNSMFYTPKIEEVQNYKFQKTMANLIFSANNPF